MTDAAITLVWLAMSTSSQAYDTTAPSKGETTAVPGESPAPLLVETLKLLTPLTSTNQPEPELLKEEDTPPDEASYTDLADNFFEEIGTAIGE